MNVSAITYSHDVRIESETFIDLLRRSTLAERRPVDDLPCIEGMLKNASLLVTAWSDDLLVGVARSVTDFDYACYLSDLAVDQSFQRQGIGRGLIKTTRGQLCPRCKIILVSASKAMTYYEGLGFEKSERTWILSPGYGSAPEAEASHDD